MKSYKPLQDAFRKLDQSTIAWHKHARFPKTMETANGVLYRDTAVDASTLAYLACCLGFTNKQTVTLLEDYAKEVPKKALEVAVLKKLIVPLDLSSGEQDLIVQMRGLDDAKRRLILDMVEKLK
jgi:hypothetical protein